MKTRIATIALLALSCARSAPPAPAPSKASARVAEAPKRVSHVDRSKLPAPGQLASWTPPAPQSSTLKNGIKVWHVERGDAPLVSLLAIFPRGSATDPKNESGTAYLMADMLDEGAGKLGALELSEELQRLATDYGSSVDVDYSMLAMDLLAENYAQSVQILSDIVRRPRFDAAEFKRRKDYFVAAALSNESQPQAARGIAMLSVLFGDGYAGRVSQGTRTSLQGITLADVKAHYRRTITPDGLEFIVVGGIDRNTTLAALEDAFGDWKGTSTAVEADVRPPPNEAGLYVVDFPGAPQTMFSVVRRAPAASSETYFPAMVFNRGFGEAFTSRVNLNLREDKGYSYGATSVFSRFRKSGYFVVATSVKTDVTRPSIDEVLREISDLCRSRPITATERDEAVSGLLLGFPSRFETLSGMAQQFAGIVIHRRPVDWFEKWPAAVQGVDVEAANRLARDNCDPNAYAIVLAGDRAAIEPSLASLGRKIVGYDRQGRRLQ